MRSQSQTQPRDWTEVNRCWVRFLLRPILKSFYHNCVLVYRRLFLHLLRLSFFNWLVYFNWRMITLQYADGGCHTSMWITHRHTCVTLFLSFNLLIWFNIWTDLHIFMNPCIPGIYQTWSQCMIFLIWYSIPFAKILLWIFPSMFIGDIGL